MLSSRFIRADCVTHYTSTEKPFSQEKWNPLQMREPTKTPMKRYGENLKRLIEIQKIPVTKVAEEARVTPKQIYNFMAAGHDARLKGLEKVANVFGLSAWQMMAVDFDGSPASNRQLLALLELYSRADEAGRAAIMQVAEIAASKASK